MVTTIDPTSKFTMKMPSQVRWDIAKESGGFGAGELASMGVSLGVVAIMDKVIPKSLLDKAIGVVSKVVIEPYLDTIERNLAKCKLEECQTDETKTREERANRLAKMALVFGSAYFISFAAKIAVRKWANKKFEIPEDPERAPKNDSFYEKNRHHIPIIGSSRAANMITFADEGVHIGSFVYLNTMGSNLSDEHIKKMSKVLEKIGVSPQKAREISTMVMVWEVPNFLGMMAGGVAIAGKHTKGWGIKNSTANHTIMDVIKGTAMSAPLSRI